MKSTAVISKIRHFTNLNTRKLLYYSLVYPYLTYGNLIWGNTYKKRIQKLINIQKKIIRLITFKSYTEHTEPLFRNLEILNFENINDYLICLFMFRYYYLENLPEVFSNYFTRNDEIRHYNTRTSSQFHKSYKRTNYAKQTLSDKGVNIWNKLDCNYKNIKSYTTFKKKIKKHLLLNNYKHCKYSHNFLLFLLVSCIFEHL
jgi:hypothetical protein